MNFLQSNADPCVFIQNVESGTTILLVWVDDIIIASSSKELMDNAKNILKDRFNMKDLGEISSFLGIAFQRKKECITMSQSCFLKELLTRFGFDQCKPRSTPCEVNPNSYQANNDTEATDENCVRRYRQMVGSLVYAMTCTRPDLSYCVTKLSQNLSSPNSSNWIMLKHVFRYVKHTVDYQLAF